MRTAWLHQPSVSRDRSGPAACITMTSVRLTMGPARAQTGVRKPPQFLRCHFLSRKPIHCQDRLGINPKTNSQRKLKQTTCGVSRRLLAGSCSLRARELPGAVVDPCGCAAGTAGWSKGDRACQQGKSTSRSEGVDCALREGRALSTECDCVGGWGGQTCQQPRREALDGCGCELGSGWSKVSADCVAGGTTSSSEAAQCTSGGGGGGGGSGSSASGAPICLSADALAPINRNCPTKRPGQLTPDTCPPACATAYLAWWARCAEDAELVALDRQSGNVFTAFSSTCGNQEGEGH
jgi:hypothetical protein